MNTTTDKKTRYPSNRHMGDRVSLLILIALFGLAFAARAQQGSQGNTTIFGGAQMTFFANHDFVSGGGGAQPGVILTDRASGSFGVLNFFGDNLTSTGGSDAGYVDGYVRKYGAGQFVFPVGDNGNIGQFAASADGTMGAYFHGDASAALTSNLFTGGNYPALPSGGPFPTLSFQVDSLERVSTMEYWDIDGTNATTVTLTWDAASDVSTLTAGQLNKLTIAGWDGTRWVAITSVVDVTSILGGTSALSAGSITSTATIVPDTYTAYTFASRVAPLPVTLVAFTAQAEGNTVMLNWSTTEENNSDRFEIQRSANGKSWAKIGIVKSQGESAVLQEYSFVDLAPSLGGRTSPENLYRLKMVDKDETFAYSRIRTVRFDSGQDLVAYPNPARDNLLIKNYDQVKQATLINSSGQKVLGTGQVSANGIDVGKLTPGTYLLTIALFDGTLNTHKIVISK